MVAIDKRYTCYLDDDGIGYVCRASAWDIWIRWVVLAVLVILFFLLFAYCSITSARRRRGRGLQPYYGTGWVASNQQYGQHPPQQQPYYGNGAQPQWNQPAPPYNAPPQYYQHDGFYGQQNGVELQNQPSAPQPAHPRSGDSVYQAPPGPPPSKTDGVIR